MHVSVPSTAVPGGAITTLTRWWAPAFHCSGCPRQPKSCGSFFFSLFPMEWGHLVAIQDALAVSSHDPTLNHVPKGPPTPIRLSIPHGRGPLPPGQHLHVCKPPVACAEGGYPGTAHACDGRHAVTVSAGPRTHAPCTQAVGLRGRYRVAAASGGGNKQDGQQHGWHCDQSTSVLLPSWHQAARPGLLA